MVSNCPSGAKLTRRPMLLRPRFLPLPADSGVAGRLGFSLPTLLSRTLRICSPQQGPEGPTFSAISAVSCRAVAVPIGAQLTQALSKPDNSLLSCLTQHCEVCNCEIVLQGCCKVETKSADRAWGSGSLRHCCLLPCKILFLQQQTVATPDCRRLSCQRRPESVRKTSLSTCTCSSEAARHHERVAAASALTAWPHSKS